METKNMFGQPDFKKGQTLTTTSDKAGGFIKMSEDGKRIQLELTGIDNHTSDVWFDLTEIIGYGSDSGVEAEEPIPDPIDEQPTIEEALKEINDTLTEQIAQLNKEKDQLTEEKEFIQRGVLITERKHNAAIVNLQDDLAEAKINALNPVDPDEVQALRATIKARDNEITELNRAQQRPLIEVINIIRHIDITTGMNIDDQVTSMLTDGFEIIPALTNVFMEDETETFERITFRRDNKQTIQPGYSDPLKSAIKNSFDAQATPERQIIMHPSNQASNDLKAEQFIQAGNTRAIAVGQEAFAKSRASHQPINSTLNNTINNIGAGITIVGGNQ